MSPTGPAPSKPIVTAKTHALYSAIPLPARSKTSLTGLLPATGPAVNLTSSLFERVGVCRQLRLGARRQHRLYPEAADRHFSAILYGLRNRRRGPAGASTGPIGPTLLNGLPAGTGHPQGVKHFTVFAARRSRGLLGRSYKPPARYELLVISDRADRRQRPIKVSLPLALQWRCRTGRQPSWCSGRPTISTSTT